MSKIVIGSTIEINSYEVISRAIEEGVRYGVMRAHKHTDNPSKESIEDAVEHAVMNSLSEVLIYNGKEEK